MQVAPKLQRKGVVFFPSKGYLGMLKWLAGSAALMIVLLGSPQRAMAEDVYARAAAIGTTLQDDPVAELAEIDATLAAAAAEGVTDPRLTFDLVRLKADLLLARGDKAEAADLIAQLATLAARYRDLLGLAPGPLYREAAGLYEDLENFRAARAQVLGALEAQRDGGLPGPVLARTLERLADLSDRMARPADAEAYRAAALAAQAEVATKESTRGPGDVGYREVEIFYATDRARTGDPDPETFYGWGRGELELGQAIVTIPDTHTKGAVEAPSIWKLEFGPNPAKHVMLKSVTPVETDAYFAAMNDRLEKRDRKEILVFIHGYNVAFEPAAKRAAQLSYDMNYDGLPVLYSWPSAGSTTGYISDTAVVELSGRRLWGFLEDLVARSGAQTIHIVAHSMGNRALTDALELMSVSHGLTAESKPIFGQVVFAAPDVDAGLFAKMIETIRPIARRLTLYASKEDWALASSRRLHGNAPRAGQGGEFVLVSDYVDSVDMSELGEDMLSHSYFADDSSALADMMSLFWHNTAPDRRCGLQQSASAAALPYWIYKRGKCQSQTLMDVMALMQRDNVQTGKGVQRLLDSAVEDTQMRDRIAPVLLRMVER